MKVPPEAFYADYHETDEAVPLMYQLARVSLEWNMVEHFFAALIWEMLGDFRTGKAVTGGMGSQSRADVVLGIAPARSSKTRRLSTVSSLPARRSIFSARIETL
jgi:hypothetical protein